MGDIWAFTRHTLLATSTLLSGAQLPAADPPQESNQKSSASRLDTEWSSTKIFEQIGAIKATTSLIDQFLRNHPQANGLDKEWTQLGEKLKEVTKRAEEILNTTPSQTIKNFTGQSLEAQHSVLKLFFNRLVDSATSPPSQQTAFPQAIGMYPEADLRGMQTAAIAFKALFADQLERRGSDASVTERKILEGLSVIEASNNPQEISQRLQPLIIDVLRQFSNTSFEKNTELQSAFTRVLSTLSPAKEESRILEQVNRGTVHDKWRGWEESLARDLGRFLNPGAKTWRAEAKLKELANSQDGYIVVTTGAGELAQYYSERDPERSKTLNKIAEAKDIEKIQGIESAWSILAGALIGYQAERAKK